MDNNSEMMVLDDDGGSATPMQDDDNDILLLDDKDGAETPSPLLLPPRSPSPAVEEKKKKRKSTKYGRPLTDSEDESDDDDGDDDEDFASARRGKQQKKRRKRGSHKKDGGSSNDKEEKEESKKKKRIRGQKKQQQQELDPEALLKKKQEATAKRRVTLARKKLLQWREHVLSRMYRPKRGPSRHGREVLKRAQTDSKWNCTFECRVVLPTLQQAETFAKRALCQDEFFLTRAATENCRCKKTLCESWRSSATTAGGEGDEKSSTTCNNKYELAWCGWCAEIAVSHGKLRDVYTNGELGELMNECEGDDYLETLDLEDTAGCVRFEFRAGAVEDVLTNRLGKLMTLMNWKPEHEGCAMYVAVYHGQFDDDNPLARYKVFGNGQHLQIGDEYEATDTEDETDVDDNEKEYD